MDVVQLGPIPTPAVAMLVRSLRADLGVMISASHNPYQDNGIKLFGPDGYKLSDDVEEKIEAHVSGDIDALLAEPDRLGQAKRIDGANDRISNTPSARSTAPSPGRPEGGRRLRERRGLPCGACRALGAGR